MFSPDETPETEAGRKLQALFSACRDGCPDPEPGPDFMPQLWQRIEARRSVRYRVTRVAQGIITAAAAAVLVMGVFLSQVPTRPSPSYLELLAADHTHNDLADTEIVQALHENGR